MTAPNDVAPLVERLTADVYPFNHDFDTISVPAGRLRQAVATIAALQAEVERAKEDEREACARIADEAARDAAISADRKQASTSSGASVLTGYVFARTEAEGIAREIRARSASRKENTP